MPALCLASAKSGFRCSACRIQRYAPAASPWSRRSFPRLLYASTVSGRSWMTRRYSRSASEGLPIAARALPRLRRAVA